MSSPARDMVSLLEASGLSFGTFASDLFVGNTPNSPNNVLAAYDTGGFEPASNYNYERPTVQITVRNNDYDDGYEIIQNVFDALNGVYEEVVGSYRYTGIWVMSGPTYIGKDDKGRWLFTLNLRLHRTKQS